MTNVPLNAADLPTALLHLSAGILAAISGWALLVIALASWRPTAQLALMLTPRLLRAVVFAGMSGSMAMGPLAAAAHADDLDGLPLPDRQTTTAVARTGHTVVAGESLWAIAQQDLGAAATPALIASNSARWYDANRAVIGDDPDLIQPGQFLNAPAVEEAR